MAETLEVQDFIARAEPILDVRSPGEFEQGRIPGAINLPLFTNAERAEVGTCYKQQGRERAIELGLKLVGPKLATFVELATLSVPNRIVRLHCWRGGLRSSSMAWLLELAGFKVKLLTGGYKAFRRWLRSTLTTERPITIVGGMTGTGKTAILQALAEQGEQILDLEQLAHHRGSSFGQLGLPPQPTTEQFENLIALQWHAFDPTRPVWLEAESRQVGRCRIPAELFDQMERSPVFEVTRSREERLQLLLHDYGQADRQGLIEATQRIQRRLGGLRTQQAIQSIQQGDLALAIQIVLDYYDKTYQYDLERRQVPRQAINAIGLSAAAVATHLRELHIQAHRTTIQDFHPNGIRSDDRTKAAADLAQDFA